MRGNFLQNFINVLLGFVLVTFLPAQLCNPPQSEFVNSLVCKELVSNRGNETSDLIKKVKACVKECALDYRDRRVSPFTINSEYTDTLCKRLETMFAQTNVAETNPSIHLIPNIRKALDDGCRSGAFLFLAIVLFTVKYLHELSRIEDLFHVKVVLPALMNFFHFFCSLVLAGAIILLIIYSDTFIPWWLLPVILIGFALNDVSLLIAKIVGWLETSVAKGWAVQWRIISTWLLLDVAILVFYLFYCVASSPHDLSPTSWNRLLACLLLLQVVFPYIIGFDFYFKDYVDEAKAIE
jgi:hypothetical protein